MKTPLTIFSACCCGKAGWKLLYAGICLTSVFLLGLESNMDFLGLDLFSGLDFELDLGSDLGLDLFSDLCSDLCPYLGGLVVHVDLVKKGFEFGSF